MIKQRQVKGQSKLILVINFFMLSAIALTPLIFAQFFDDTTIAEESQISITYCAERTISGAWCQNVPLEQVDQNYRSIPSSCESSSYCRLGYCYDRTEGTCLENTPEQVCNNQGGIWTQDTETGEPPQQCQLGCCVLGDQAAFTTQVRCQRLSSVYGLETDYRADIQNEIQCISSVASEVKGACVIEQTFVKNCRFITKNECDALGAGTDSETDGNSINFYENRLCTDPALETICAPTKDTICLEGQDEVYFVDTCGNIANIYDASKVNDENNYWAEVFDKDESCGFGQSNSDSKNCGNCNYFLGSTCKAYSRTEDKSRPTNGNFICRDLACEYEGETYQHGETWCADAQGIDEAAPGSRYFRLVCYNGDVTVEPCADFRQEVCLESEVNGFKSAACRVNQWQDCYSQDNQRDCENIDRRDCVWIDGIDLNRERQGSATTNEQDVSVSAFADSGTEETSENENNGDIQNAITGQAIFDEETLGGFDFGDGACVPRDAPGLDFWNPNTDAQSLCSLGNSECIVRFEKNTFGDWEPVENEECLEDSWGEKLNNVCVLLGDCGGDANYLGVQGYDKGYEIDVDKYKGEEDDDNDGGLFNYVISLFENDK